MARKLTTEERLEKIAKEAKELKEKLANERREAEQVAFNLLGEAVWRLFRSEESEEGKADAKTRVFALAKHLPKKKADRLIRAIEKLK